MPPVPAVSVVPPIVDLRPHLHWRWRWPARVGTGALWLGTLGLVGPAKLAGLLVASSLVAPPLLLLERTRRQQQPLLPRTAPGLQEANALPRSLAAERFGLPESQLFRARHAAICTVHHDDAGSIVGLEWPCPVPVVLTTSPDAHPVG